MSIQYKKLETLNEEYVLNGGYMDPMALVQIKPKFRNISFPYRLIQNAPFTKIAKRLYPGRCYSFIYKPTTNVEDFDRTPQILLLQVEKDLSEFWGLNFHHLDTKLLSTFFRNYNVIFPELGSIKKMPTLQQFQQNKIFGKYSIGLRHYKLSGLQSKFYEIDTKYWATTALVPTLKNIVEIEK